MQSQNWCFTWNNPDVDRLFLNESDGESFSGTSIVLPDYVQYLVYQRERGDNGTEHFQGYLETDRRIRINQLKNINARIHWEARRGSQAQAVAYCQKADSRIDGPWEHGVPRESRSQGSRTDLVSVAERIAQGADFQEIENDFPGESIRFRRHIMEACRDRRRRILRRELRPNLTVTVLWGDPGTGKTRSVYESEGIENIYTLTECHNGSIWFDGYDNESVLLIDDFRGWIKYTTLLKMLDIFPYRLPIKGSFDYAAWTKVYITSNHPIEEWYRTDSGHCIGALRRRIHRVEHFTADHPWQPIVGGLSGDVAHSGESDVVTVLDDSELDAEDE